MDRVCERCTHYRAQRNLVECLTLGNSLELAPSLQNVAQTEQALLAKEEAFKMQALAANRGLWPFKPQVQAYCALEEAQNAYFVPEVKNPHRRCADFVEDRLGSALPCETCAHHQPAAGHTRDHQNLMEVISPAHFHSSMRIDDQGSPSAPCSITNDLQTVMQASQKGQSLEMLMALNGGGTLAQPPQYYASCRKYSTPRKYALCRMQNPHGRCPGHSLAASPSPADPPEPDEWSQPARTASGDVEGGASRRPRSMFFRNLARRLVKEIDDD